jgi:hypothetical protein
LLGAFKRILAALPNECAVCIPDGAKLILHGITPALQRSHGVCAIEHVTFRQLSAEAATYRDAVEFGNGRKVRLQDLEEGQTVVVTALSPAEVEVEDLFLTKSAL